MLFQLALMIADCEAFSWSMELIGRLSQNMRRIQREVHKCVLQNAAQWEENADKFQSTDGPVGSDKSGRIWSFFCDGGK